MNGAVHVGDWTRRTIHGARVGDDHPPAWLSDAYATFRANLLDDAYPCYFGTQAERDGKLYYSYVSGRQLDHLPTTLQTFLRVCTNIGQDKNNLVVFFEPDVVQPSHAQHRTAFWDTLQYLRDRDPLPSASSYPIDTSDPCWDFPFCGKLFFIVGISPAYRLHRSRNLGPGMTMVFQPREVFQNGTAGTEIGAAARARIRLRAELWDGVPAHPDLNSYGRPGNLEWAQYFMSDDNVPETGRCPLSGTQRVHQTTE
ncbi:MAG: YqcI/YcgG family protein [Candidatus Eremiobacteraeota bacterium]|nr:YqcI/YcgG family protein [Candidatus Eremiobacteraeota bacterium]